MAGALLMFAIAIRQSFLQIWDHVVLLFIGNFAVLAAALSAAFAIEGAALLGPLAVTLASALSMLLLCLLLLVYAVGLDHAVQSRPERFDWRGGACSQMLPATFGTATAIASISAGWLVAERLLPLRSSLDWLGLTLLGWSALVALQITTFSLTLSVMGLAAPEALRLAAIIAFRSPIRSLLLLLLAVILALSSLVILPGLGGAFLLLRSQLRLELRCAAIPGVSWREFLAEEKEVGRRLSPRALLFPWRP